jgi:hypothetical protein
MTNSTTPVARSQKSPAPAPVSESDVPAVVIVEPDDPPLSPEELVKISAMVRTGSLVALVGLGDEPVTVMVHAHASLSTPRVISLESV